MGLLKDEKKKGIRVNDPGNPGRVYFSGKGLDFPFSLYGKSLEKLERVIRESDSQVRKMITKVSDIIHTVDKDLFLDFNEIKQKYSLGMVRERHVARVIRIKIFEKYKSSDERKTFIQKLYGGRNPSADINSFSATENEIRSILLKAGGPAYVPEDTKAFPELDEIIRIILDAGGIPCYPVLLDDSNGHFTEYERDYELLYQELVKRKIHCIELIPCRNDFYKLKEFVHFFHARNFIILFGTEHNTPDLTPLTVMARNETPLDEELKIISFEGACVTAAHQYQRAKNEEGFIGKDGSPGINEKEEFIELGNAVIEYFLQNQL